MTPLTTKAVEIRAGLVAELRMCAASSSATQTARDIAGRAAALIEQQAAELAEQHLRHETGERITRKDLNNAYRSGQENGRLFAETVENRLIGERAEEDLAAEASLDLWRNRASTAESERDELLREKERLGAEVERVSSDRQYVIGWNDGFAHVNGPLRFPTMLRKMWSGGEVQAWLDAQRIEAAREAAADEGSALTRAETTIASQSERIAVLEAALRKCRSDFCDILSWHAEERIPLRKQELDHIRARIAEIDASTRRKPRARAALAPLGEE